MTYNLDFLITSFLFLLLILYHFVNRRRLEDTNSRIFRVIIVLGITDIAFDIFTTILICEKRPELAVFTTLMLTIFYILQVLVPYVLFLYCSSLWRGSWNQNSSITLFLSLPAFFMAIMVLINYASGIFFSIDALGNYIAGPLYLGMYIYAGLYVFIILIGSLRYHHSLGYKNFCIIIEFLLIMAICVAVQAVWHDMLTTGLGLGLGITVFYLTINNPSDYTDYLTEDFNTKGLLEWLGELFWRKKNFHIIAITIHDLKKINMLYGIRFGDSLLCQISKKLHEILNTPYVFRLSSKRFVLFTNSLQEYERVRDEVKTLFCNGITLKEEHFPLCAVICGILDAQNLENSDTFLSYIDYLSSLPPESSETVVIQSDEKTLKNFQYRKEIERFLRTAIEKDLFEVHYQPIFSLEKGEFFALEALSRLKHPAYGPVPPDVFITIAERSGQITRIGLLQLRRICTFIKEHPELMDKIDHINVNLSPAELLREGYDQQIIETIREFSLPFSFFQLEITETVATEYSNRLYQLTKNLKRHGIRLSLDDFGSGYANLNAVLRLPFSCIKLDRSLLNGIMVDKNVKSFYKNIVTALKSMGYDVISEGVEMEKEVQLLKSLGVDMIQGFYFSMPLTSKELLKLLKDEL